LNSIGLVTVPCGTPLLVSIISRRIWVPTLAICKGSRKTIKVDGLLKVLYGNSVNFVFLFTKYKPKSRFFVSILILKVIFVSLVSM
jgi:hypothetical protein